MDAVFRLTEGAALERRVQLVRSGPTCLVSCDRERIIRLLGNLVGNAIRFAPPGSKVEARVEPRREEVLIHVSDRGPGIPPIRRASLFDAWSKGGGPGSGLGLFIAKGIAGAHGGRIWLANGDPGKCTFSLALPRGAKSAVDVTALIARQRVHPQ